MTPSTTRGTTRLLSVVAAGLAALASVTPALAAPALVGNINIVGDADPQPAVNLNGFAIFAATDGSNGYELWKSTGGWGGTEMILDINPGSGDSFPGVGGMVVLGGAVYFDADDGTNGVELWKTDGTPGGTVMVKDIQAGGDSSPGDLTLVGSTLYFRADDGSTGVELWKSDGTATGTVLVADINPLGDSNPLRITDVNGTAYFSANDGGVGIELWKSTGSGATLVKDVNPLGSSAPNHLTNVAGTLFFSANDGTTGSELWKTDGTSAGTVQVKDIRSGANSSSPGNGGGLVNMGGRLVFDANDGLTGRELWSSDGTAAGTVLLKDINGGGSSSPGSNSGFVIAGGTLFFNADDGSFGDELWKSDGTEAGTVMVKDIEAGAGDSSPSEMVNVNGTLAMNACDSAGGCEPWWSDGTAAGTVRAADIAPGIFGSDPYFFTAIGDKVFFAGDNGIDGLELFSDYVCAPLDDLVPGCVPASADAAKCAGSLGKLTLKLIGADRKCAVKNSDAAVAAGSYEGQTCEDVARYRFLGGIASMQLKAPGCVATCFGAGDPDYRATAIEATVDALHGAIYCDATSGTEQDDGFGGWVPADATAQACSNALTKLAGSLSKSIVGCDLKKASATVNSVAFDLAACQATAIDRYETSAAALTGCPACVRPEGIRDEIVQQSNNADAAALFCDNGLF